MLDIPFCDSGSLKYYKDDRAFHYSYAINGFEYPTMHGHVDYWEFCIVTEGCMKHCMASGEEVICKSQTLSFMTTADRHSFLKMAKKIRYVNISVRESHLTRLLELISTDFRERLLRGARCFPISETLIGEVEKLLHQCNLLREEQVEQKNGLLCSALLLILQELNRIHLNVAERLSPLEETLLAMSRNRDFVRYTVRDLQRELNYSSAHLNRLFREHFGVSPNEYLQEYRFCYAQNLLRNTDMSVSEIAYAIGYSNLSHFFGQFKRRYGVPPREWRNRRIHEAQSPVERK